MDFKKLDRELINTFIIPELDYQDTLNLHHALWPEEGHPITKRTLRCEVCKRTDGLCFKHNYGPRENSCKCGHNYHSSSYGHGDLFLHCKNCQALHMICPKCSDITSDGDGDFTEYYLDLVTPDSTLYLCKFLGYGGDRYYKNHDCTYVRPNKYYESPNNEELLNDIGWYKTFDKFKLVDYQDRRWTYKYIRDKYYTQYLIFDLSTEKEVGKWSPLEVKKYTEKYSERGIVHLVDDQTGEITSSKYIGYFYNICPQEDLEYKMAVSKIEHTFITHYFGDKDQYYFPLYSDLELTGPDGGSYHYWRCMNCDKIIEDTDK